MALDQKFFKKSTTATGLADQEQGIITHLDANDVDSYDGDGSIWYDINGHEVNIPLADKASNLQLHLNASDTSSYSGSGSTWTDISGNTSNNGSITGATFASDTRGYFDFDGTNDFVEVTASSNIDIGSGGFTYETWLLNEKSSGTSSVISNLHNVSGYTGYTLRINNGTDVRLIIYSNTAVIFNQNYSSSVTTNTWTHLAFTVASASSGAAVKLYINGNLSSVSGTLSGAYVGSGQNIQVGQYPYLPTGRYFNGKMGVVRIYNSELTASEIGQNYRAGNFLSYSSIITPKHEATQGTLITSKQEATQGTLYTSNLQVNLDANSYSGSGNWLDSSGNSNNGVIYGATYTNDNNSDYFTFDGVDDKITNSDCNLDSANVSITAWVWLDHYGTGDGTSIVHLGSGSTAGTSILFRERSNGKLSVYDFGAANLDTDNVELSLSTWHYVALTVSGTTYKLYVDGVEKKSGTETAYSGDDRLIIGNYNNVSSGSASQFWDGRIAIVKLYNVALTPTQVAQNYNATKALYQNPNLNLSLDANGYSGSGDWQDGANNNDGVISGATYTNDSNSDYFDFDGSNDKITVAGADLNPANTKSIELWFNTDSTSEQYIISNNNGSGGAYGYHMGVTSGKLFLWIYSQEQAHYYINLPTGSTPAITVGQWNHVVWTIGSNASDNKIYLNGVLGHTASSTGGGTFPSTAAHNGIIIGTYGSSGWFDGKLAQVRAYSAALTQAQITTNYDATKALYQNPTLNANFDAANYTSGAWVDSVNSNSGTVNNASFDKELGNFFDFNRSNDNENITVSDSASLSPTSALSIEVIVNPDSFSNHQRIIWKNGSYGLYASANGLYTFFINSTSNQVQGTLNETGKFKHIVGTFDGSNMKIYINGILQATTSLSASITDNSNTFTIGGDGTTARYYDGQIGFVRLFSSALTSAQVVQNYLATKSDYPNGNNATLVGSPTWGTNSSPTYNYFDLNGSSQYMTIPHNTIFDFERPTTLEIWVNKDGTGREWVIEKANGGSSTYSWQLLHQNTTSNYLFQMHNTSAGTITINVNSATNTGTWYHIAVTHDGNNVFKIYLNGSLQESATLSGTISKNTNGVTIGKYSLAGGYEFDGKIGMVKFHDRTFSATEVDAAFDNTKATFGVT